MDNPNNITHKSEIGHANYHFSGAYQITGAAHNALTWQDVSWIKNAIQERVEALNGCQHLQIFTKGSKEVT